MILPVFAIVVSLALLALSADKFVDGASSIAYHYGVSPLLIGLTIVSFGTSAPEILIAVMSATSDNSDIAVGNAIGSNIANIALILGVASVFKPMPVSSTVLRREIPLLLCVVLFSTALLYDLMLSRFDGVALMTTLFICLGWLVWQGKSQPDDVMGEETEERVDTRSDTTQSIIITTVALVVLLVSSKTLVWGAVEIARAANVSELMIGLSIIAVGTSLPELAATIACVVRREFDLAIGNVVGSNLFNALSVLGVVALLAPGEVAVAVLQRDALMHVALTICLFVFCVGWRKASGRINRFEGLFFVCVFIAYQWLLYRQEGVA
ncbi:hypothetical protein AB833_17020 [Chromatiales bacterium (ex Bugula neritina AB1)]|nr:hypothetical protein AB833_17020 [Chromatiales bacterium (ex Bugula neritina AB1)]